MGFRFRRSVTIIPGVRLNFSTSGVSTSIGPRGASMTFSERGTYANLGLPGTGFSYRTRIDRAPPTRAVARSTYRQLQRLQREAERAQELAEAASTHANREAALQRLRTVHSDRVTAAYDFNRLWASRGAFQRLAFVAPAPEFSEETIAKAAAAQRPWWGWAAGSGVSALVAILISVNGSAWQTMAVGTASVIGAAGAVWAVAAAASQARLQTVQALYRHCTETRV